MSLRKPQRFGAYLALACYSTGSLKGADLRPSVEVASVKAIGPNDHVPFSLRGGPGSDSPTLFQWQGTVLMTVLTRAYQVPPDQIAGPDWLMKDLFSITAKIPPNTDEKRFDLMLQRLIEERFHLTIHHGVKKLPAYDLVIAKGGPKLKPSPPNPSAPPPSSALPTGKFDSAGFPVLAPGATQLISARDPLTVRATFRTTMSAFATQLGMMVAQSTGDGGATPRVVDKTGFAGSFEFKLEFAKARQLGPGNTDEPENVGPSIFTALKEQLGLTLVRGKTIDGDLIVIDRIDRTPTQN